MNISFDKVDELNATIIIDLEKKDFADKVESELKKMQKRVVVNGFRPGKAPLDMVKKMYGRSILADELNNTTGEALSKYIQENNLDVLGSPINSSRIESDINLETGDNFKFAFDLGLAPSFELQVSDKDHLTLFDIAVSDKEVNEDIENARKRHGKLEDVDSAEAEDIIYATMTELGEDGNPLDGGVADKQISVVSALIKDEVLKGKLIGSKTGDNFTVNIFQLFNDNDTVISNSFAIPKEGVKDLNPDFSFAITAIKRRTLAEINEAYFQEIFGPQDFPASEEEYRERIKTNLTQYYKTEAQLWLDHEIGHMLMGKHKIQLPDEFLKRWLLQSNEKEYSEENISEKYEAEKDVLVRRLIIDKIADENQIESTEEEITEEAKGYYIGMYRQYGMNMIPDDNFLMDTVKKRLGEREFVRQMQDRVVYRKAYDKVKEMISVDEKPISVEDYFAHVNSHKHTHGE